MPLKPAERTNIDRHSDMLLSMSESALRKAAVDASSSLVEALTISSSAPYQQFWIPFDWVNEGADVVIVGLTPGFQQAEEALASMRSSLLMGLDAERIAERAKQAGAFKGQMRSLGARLMDHFGINDLLGLSSTDSLFGADAGRIHCTSLLRNPVLKAGKNYSGDDRLMRTPDLRDIANATLIGEIERLDDPWIITFGPVVGNIIEDWSSSGKINGDKLLTGILHPSGQQWNRYKVQLGITPRDEAADVSGGLATLERSDGLRKKVAAALRN